MMSLFDASEWGEHHDRPMIDMDTEGGTAALRRRVLEAVAEWVTRSVSLLRDRGDDYVSAAEFENLADAVGNMQQSFYFAPVQGEGAGYEGEGDYRG